MSGPDVRIIIVGGGISGLTLANALQHIGVDYVLLEARDDIAPQLGASIGLAPYGLRILDQLGVYPSIQQNHTPIHALIQRQADGRPFHEIDTTIDGARFGYLQSFSDRQWVLQSLYDRLDDKSKVLIKKRVRRITHEDTAVEIECDDETSYRGDILVGADGVRSMVRSEMQRLSSSFTADDPGQSPLNYLTAEFACMFGISKAPTGKRRGVIDFVHDKDRSLLAVTSLDGRIFWFLYQKMGRVYRGSNIPRFTSEDDLSYVLPALDRMHIREGVKSYSFRDLWNDKTVWALVPLEEGLLNSWTWGRIACVGDSVHKVTPDIGAGGNGAIESAAALANNIHRLLKSHNGKPGHQSIQNSLQQYQKDRWLRIKPIVAGAFNISRVNTYSNFRNWFSLRCLSPFLGDAASDWSVTIGAELVGFLPVPNRSTNGTCPFNKEQGLGKGENTVDRVGSALPLLAIGVLFSVLIQLVYWFGLETCVSQILQDGKYVAADGALAIPLVNGPLGDSLAGRIWDRTSVIFLPSVLGTDPMHRARMVSFLIDGAPFLAVWLAESSRRANEISVLRCTVLIGMLSQVFNRGLVYNIAFFIHYVESPIEIFAASDQRMLRMNRARTILPTILIAYLPITLASYFYHDLQIRMIINYAWQVVPIYICIVHWLLSTFLVQDTTKHDRLHNVRADLPALELLSNFLLATSVISCQLMRWYAFDPWFIGHFIFEMISTPLLEVTSLEQGAALVLRYDYLCMYGGACVWLLLLFRDLKRAKMIDHDLRRLAMYLVMSLLVIGPGATLILGWRWRERTLATRRHWAVVTG